MVCQISRKKHYECVRFNVISVTRGWVGVKFPGTKRHVAHEWPLWQSLQTNKTKSFNDLVRLQYVPVDIDELDRLYVVDEVGGSVQRVHHLIVQ